MSPAKVALPLVLIDILTELAVPSNSSKVPAELFKMYQSLAVFLINKPALPLDDAIDLK